MNNKETSLECYILACVQTCLSRVHLRSFTLKSVRIQKRMEEYLQATGPVILALPIHDVRKKHDIVPLLASMKTFEVWHWAHVVDWSRDFSFILMLTIS